MRWHERRGEQAVILAANLESIEPPPARQIEAPIRFDMGSTEEGSPIRPARIGDSHLRTQGGEITPSLRC